MLRTNPGQEFGPANIAVLVEWAKQGRVPRDAMLVPTDQGIPCRASEHPQLAAILAAPPMVAGPVPQIAPGGDDVTSKVIPYRNPKALIGYYFAIGNLIGMIIPIIGPILSGIVIWLGVSGWRFRRANPSVHGAAHAWIAIIGGSIELLISLVITVGMIIGLVTAAAKP